MNIQLSGAGVALVLAAGLVHAQSMAPRWKAFPDQFSAAQKNCYSCKDGEAMAESIVTIPHSNYVDIDSPPCAERSIQKPSLSRRDKEELTAAYYMQPPGVGRFAAGIGNAHFLAMRDKRPSVFTQMRNRARDYQVSSCGRNLVIVPKAANITRVEPSMKCPAGGWCAQDPMFQEELDENLRVFAIVGKNWSHNMSADSILRVFYQR
jgi:hypothetical protein